MKKTIIGITLLSFTFLSLHVHIHENDQLDHASLLAVILGPGYESENDAGESAGFD